MLQTFIRFMRDDRGGDIPAALLPLAAAAGLAALAAHGLHHHLAHGLGVMPDGLGSLDPGAAGVGAAAVGTVKKGWEWDSSGKNLYVDKNMARDRFIFAPPRLINPPTKQGQLHSGQIRDVVAWQWPADNRVFLVPVELFYITKLCGMVRDIVSAAGQLYRDQGFPAPDAQVSTSYRKISDMIGVAFNGRVAAEIEMCFAYARSMTILNHPVITQLDKTGRVKKQDMVTFGFIDYVARADIRDGKKAPKNQAPLNIVLSTLYATALRNLPPAPLPVAALEAAHRAPGRLVTPTKNLAYYLASRVPMSDIRLRLPTIRDILGFAERSDGKTTRTRRAIESVLNILSPVMISDYQYVDDGFNIMLSGMLSGLSGPAGNKS